MKKRIGLFRVPISSTEEVYAALAMGVAWNCWYLRHHPSAPHPYKAGWRYVPEPPGMTEDWQLYEDLLESKEGDCEDFAMALCAWFIVREGRDAECAVFRYPATLHITVKVKRPGGQVEIHDPSLVLGMEV